METELPPRAALLRRVVKKSPHKYSDQMQGRLASMPHFHFYPKMYFLIKGQRCVCDRGAINTGGQTKKTKSALA